VVVLVSRQAIQKGTYGQNSYKNKMDRLLSVSSISNRLGLVDSINAKGLLIAHQGAPLKGGVSMRRGSILHQWFLEDFSEDRERMRAVESLLEKGFTGLAESVVCRALKAKNDKATVTAPVGKIRVNHNGLTEYI